MVLVRRVSASERAKRGNEEGKKVRRSSRVEGRERIAEEMVEGFGTD